eukprot:90980_1
MNRKLRRNVDYAQMKSKMATTYPQHASNPISCLPVYTQSTANIRESMIVRIHCGREMVHHYEVNEIYLSWIATSTLSMCIARISDWSYFMENSEIFYDDEF